MDRTLHIGERIVRACVEVGVLAAVVVDPEDALAGLKFPCRIALIDAPFGKQLYVDRVRNIVDSATTKASVSQRFIDFLREQIFTAPLQPLHINENAWAGGGAGGPPAIGYNRQLGKWIMQFAGSRRGDGYDSLEPLP